MKTETQIDWDGIGTALVERIEDSGSGGFVNFYRDLKVISVINWFRHRPEFQLRQNSHRKDLDLLYEAMMDSNKLTKTFPVESISAQNRAKIFNWFKPYLASQSSIAVGFAEWIHLQGYVWDVMKSAWRIYDKVAGKTTKQLLQLYLQSPDYKPIAELSGQRGFTEQDMRKCLDKWNERPSNDMNYEEDVNSFIKDFIQSLTPSPAIKDESV